MSARPYSRVLAIAASNLGLFWVSILILATRVVPEPEHLILTVLMLYVCPIGGLFVVLSLVKKDLKRGASKWRTALGVVLALAMFVDALQLMAHH